MTKVTGKHKSIRHNKTDTSTDVYTYQFNAKGVATKVIIESEMDGAAPYKYTEEVLLDYLYR